MSTDTSAYATLGLEPGADASAIKRAYKNLMKLHHPDREGGDAGRAAEITRAYRELRLAGEVREPLDLDYYDDLSAPRTHPVRTAVMMLALAGAVTLIAGPMLALGPPSAIRAPVAAAVARPAATTNLSVIGQPVAGADIDSAVDQALRIAGSQDEMALASASRDCHEKLRQNPRITQLDRCAAFDAAAVQLLDRDPLRDRGPFSELAVTGRLMSAATIFSNDYLAIDSRLDAIRLRVELSLAARRPAQPAEGTTTG